MQIIGEVKKMGVYVTSISTAALFTMGISVIIFIPWLIYTYRKYGFLSFSKMAITFSFIFYAIAALFLVLLPLPTTRDTCAMQPADTVHYNLHLFQFIDDILYKSGIVLSEPATWRFIIKQPAFYQAFFNFLLLLPLGVYLRYFWQKRKYAFGALGVGLLVSLFFEITQYTGIYGIYNCAYRLFDVDDLLLNSTGAFVGYLIGPIFLLLLPTHQAVVEKTEELAKRNIVQPGATILALLIDVITVMLGSTVLALILPNAWYSNFVATTSMLVLLFVVVPLLGKGATLGMRFMRFRMTGAEGEKALKRSTLRRFLAIYFTYLTYVLLSLISTMTAVELDMDSIFYAPFAFINVGIFLVLVILTFIIMVHVLRVWLSKGKRQLYMDKYANLYATRRNE